MSFQQFAAHDRLRHLFAGFTGAGPWILASLIPAAFLSCLLALTLYAIPETDDFCLSYQNSAVGFVETARIWYFNVVGRVVPLFLIQIPNAAGRVFGIDYFLGYTATLVAFEIGLASTVLLMTFRLWPQAKLWQSAFLAAALLATMLSRAPSLREMLYWLPGVTCYVLPGAIVAIVLVEFARAAEADSPIGPRATYAMAIASFVASLCNEFTPGWVIGLLLCSLAVRAIFRQDLQVKAHAVVGIAALAGFLILLFAPGNAVRIGQFPLAGNLERSISEAYLLFKLNWSDVFLGRTLQVWLIIVAIFSVMQPDLIKAPAWKRLLLAALVPAFCFACGYLAHFTAQYATGSGLATRAQNQVMMFFVVGSTISVAVLSRAVRSVLPPPALSLIELYGSRSAIAPILLGIFLILPLYHSTTMRILRSEASSLRVYWLESMERHAQLTFSTETAVAVARHSVFPAFLVGEDLGPNPDRLPNDCIARFYGKTAVTLAAPKGTVADALPLIASLIHEGRATQDASQGQDLASPSALSPGQNLSTLFGRVVLTRSGGTATLDFYSLPKKICPELLFEVSKLEGVLRVAGSGSSADERIAPISLDVSERSCSADGTFARVILNTAH